MSDAKKKLYIKTYGCQMNVYDSSRMADVLAPLGYEETTAPDGADMVILNTCHIREKAAEKVYSELGRIRQLQDQKADTGGKMTVAVAGCVAQAEGAEIMRRAPNVDMVFGPQSYHKLPEMVARAARGSGQVLDTDFPVEDKFDALPAETHVQGLTAFLTVQEGCDKFCTFCVVPYTRGSEYSRNAAAIIDEAKRLVDLGARDITLLGQNVNAWYGEGLDGNQWSFARLIEELATIDKLWRIRFTTSHPKDMQQDLLDAFRDIDKLMPYLHLPVQSGSDRILEAMNRRHKADDYIRLVDMLRDARPDLALSGDFITGFPGESRRDFDDTMKLVKRVEYAQAYSFNYSARPGTPAAGLPDMLSKEEKNERLYELQALLTDQQKAFNAAQVGKTLPVLLEKPGRKDGQLIGRSPYMQAVHLDAPAEMLGQLANVEILEARPNSLAGRLSEPSQRKDSAAA